MQKWATAIQRILHAIAYLGHLHQVLAVAADAREQLGKELLFQSCGRFSYELRLKRTFIFEDEQKELDVLKSEQIPKLIGY